MSMYKGEKQWAPCFHGEEDGEEKETDYIRQVLAKFTNPALGR